MGFNMRRLHFWLEPKTSQSTATRCHSVLRLHQNSASRRLATELSALLTSTLFPSWSLTSPREPPASACPRAACRRGSGSRPGRPSPPSEGRSLVSPPASSPGCRLNAALDPKPRAPRTPIPPPSCRAVSGPAAAGPARSVRSRAPAPSPGLSREVPFQPAPSTLGSDHPPHPTRPLASFFPEVTWSPGLPSVRSLPGLLTQNAQPDVPPTHLPVPPCSGRDPSPTAGSQPRFAKRPIWSATIFHTVTELFLSVTCPTPHAAATTVA